MTSLEHSEPTPEAAGSSRNLAAPASVESETDRLLAALDHDERFRDTRERRESLALMKVIRLAPTIEVAEALLRGEKVPRSKLDPDALRAYGRP